MNREEKIDGCGCLVTFFIFMLFLGCLLPGSYDAKRDTDLILYDRQNDKLVSQLGFFQLMADRGKYGDKKQYYDIPVRKEILGVSGNVSFKAKLVMPRVSESVKKFALRQAKGTADEDLFKAVQGCVASVIKIPNKIKDYPDISARAWSISNMNFHCPLAAEYGYQWNGNLEIAQCFGPGIKDVRDKGLCVELVNGR